MKIKAQYLAAQILYWALAGLEIILKLILKHFPHSHNRMKIHFFPLKDRNAPIMQQLSNLGVNNANMGRGGGGGGGNNMNPMAVLQLLQSLQGLSTLAQLTSNLGALGGSSLASGGGFGGGGGGSGGMGDSPATNPLAALSGLGMLGNTLGFGGGGGSGGGSSSGMGGLSSSLHSDSGASGRQVFVRNVSN